MAIMAYYRRVRTEAGEFAQRKIQPRANWITLKANTFHTLTTHRVYTRHCVLINQYLNGSSVPLTNYILRKKC
jgi:hypothetical protein